MPGTSITIGMATYNGDNEVKMTRDSENRPIGSDRKMFSRAMIWTAIALFLILVAAVLIVRPWARSIQPVTPNGRSALYLSGMQQFG
jgi:hypothetical protein